MISNIYYTVYKITNKINGFIYIGVHKTQNINDSYYGSGTDILEAIKTQGKENFNKEILFTFDNKDDALSKERELVNKEFIKREDTYNIIVGGGKLNTLGLIVAKDSKGKMLLVPREDTRLVSGKLVHNSTDLVSVKDSDGNILCISVDDERYINGELKHVACGNIVVKDSDGNIICVDKEDERYINGELNFIWKDKKHTEESKVKMSVSRKGTGKGSSNSQYGTCWVYNLELKVSKKVKIVDLEQCLDDGWKKGRKIKF